LAEAEIEEQILQRYDRKHTFFYLDPPYYGIKVYRLNFGSDDFRRMPEALKALAGRFICR
jgi:DNA adenine methylase